MIHIGLQKYYVLKEKRLDRYWCHRRRAPQIYASPKLANWALSKLPDSDKYEVVEWVVHEQKYND